MNYPVGIPLHVASLTTSLAKKTSSFDFHRTTNSRRSENNSNISIHTQASDYTEKEFDVGSCFSSDQAWAIFDHRRMNSDITWNDSALSLTLHS